METPARPVSVTILGFNDALSSAITGALDIFCLSGVTWQHIHDLPQQQLFSVQLATCGGAPVRCSHGISLTPSVAIEDVSTTDVLLIPSIGKHMEHVLTSSAREIEQIRRFHDKGTDIAANCTGVFLLGKSGILKDKKATTHWGFADKFRQTFPDVNLMEEQLLVNDGNIFCAGGGMSWFDLALLLIERYYGYDVSLQSSRAHVLDRASPSQTVYAGSKYRKYHQDPVILSVQDMIDQHFGNELELHQLAESHSLTIRTLIRRFKKACDQTPVQYIQSVRIDQAKRLLETTSWPVSRVVQEVGYEDQSSFTKLFIKKTGLSPARYRHAYNRILRQPVSS